MTMRMIIFLCLFSFLKNPKKIIEEEKKERQRRRFSIFHQILERCHWHNAAVFGGFRQASAFSIFHKSVGGFLVKLNHSKSIDKRG